MTTLADLIAQLDQQDDRHVIYAEPRWRAGSRAVATLEPEDGTLPDEALGMTYLVSVLQAKRIVAGRYRPHDDIADLCRAVIYYGIYDQVEPTPSIREREFSLAV